MDHRASDFSGGGSGRPSRKELQGPRPAPLKVRKDSHKIKKPPIAPSSAPPQQLPPPQQPRQPVIIYTVSPKVIHANPSEFMTLVQRLTGPDHATSSSTSTSSDHHHVRGAISPAARFASIELTKMPLEGKKLGGNMEGQDIEIVESSSTRDQGVDGIERRVFFPGILSPGPGSLPPISPNLFSPFFHDPNFNMSNFYNNLGLNNNNNGTVHQHGGRSYIDGSYMTSPFSTNFFSPSTISPSSLELLHQIMDS